jgi:hypothetical protein
MTLEQIILYHRYGWKTKETDYHMMWGILGQLLNGEDPEEKVKGLKTFKESHPEGQMKDGAYRVSR